MDDIRDIENSELLGRIFEFHDSGPTNSTNDENIIKTVVEYFKNHDNIHTDLTNL